MAEGTEEEDVVTVGPTKTSEMADDEVRLDLSPGSSSDPTPSPSPQMETRSRPSSPVPTPTPILETNATSITITPAAPAAPVPTDNAVIVRHAYKGYGLGRAAQLVLKDLDMDVRRGTIYGLLGASGCGKTTLLSCILGIRKLDAGDVRVLGARPGTPGYGVPGRSVGFMPQSVALLPDFSIREILFFFGRIHGMSPHVIREKTLFLIKFLELPYGDQIIRNLSGGQQRRVSFASALLHDPELLLLDEPTVGLDPLLRQNIWKHLISLTSRRKHTVIITTHYIEEARHAHAVGLMRSGRLLAEDAPELLMASYQVQTLEEVFLKLCVRDVDAPQMNAEPISTLSPFRRLFQMATSTESVVGLTFNSTKDLSIDGLSYKKQDNPLRSTPSLPPSKKRGTPCCYSCNAMSTRFTALVGKNFRRIARNVHYASFVVLLPVFLIVVFCSAVGRDPHHLTIALVNNEFPDDPICQPYYGCAFVNLSCNFLDQINPNSAIFQPYATEEEAEKAVYTGDAWAMLAFPANYSDSLVVRVTQTNEADNSTIFHSIANVRIDMSNQHIGFMLQRILLEGFRSFSRGMLEKCEVEPALGDIPLVFGEPIHGERFPQFMEFMAPGVLMSIIYCFSMALMLLVFALERREEMTERLQAAGVRAGEIVASYITSQYVLMLGQIALVLPFTFLVFNVPARGPIGWIVALLVLHGTSGMTLGVLISSFTKEELAAVHVGICVCFQLLILSGTVWPLEGMPDILRYASYLMPTTLGTEALRSMLLRGWGILHPLVWPGFAAGGIWICFNIAVLSIAISCSGSIV